MQVVRSSAATGIGGRAFPEMAMRAGSFQRRPARCPRAGRESRLHQRKENRYRQIRDTRPARARYAWRRASLRTRSCSRGSRLPTWRQFARTARAPLPPSACGWTCSTPAAAGRGNRRCRPAAPRAELAQLARRRLRSPALARYAEYPSGFPSCQRHASRHICPIPCFALQPKSRSASDASA